MTTLGALVAAISTAPASSGRREYDSNRATPVLGATRSSPSTPTKLEFGHQDEEVYQSPSHRLVAPGLRRRSRSEAAMAPASPSEGSASNPPHDNVRRNRQQIVSASPPTPYSYAQSSPSAVDMRGAQADSQSSDNSLRLDLEGLDLGGPALPYGAPTQVESHNSPGKKPSWVRSTSHWHSHSSAQQSGSGSVGSTSTNIAGKKRSASKHITMASLPISTPSESRRSPPQPSAQIDSGIDSFVAHLRDDCSGTNEILGSDAILSANAAGVSASTNQGGALTLESALIQSNQGDQTATAPTPSHPYSRSPSQSISIPRTLPRTSSVFAEPRGSPPKKRTPWQEAISDQVLGAFASLGLPSTTLSSQHTSASTSSKVRPTLTASARSTSRSGGPSSSLAESNITEATSPTSGIWSTTSLVPQKRWQAMVPVKRDLDAEHVLDMLSIDEISKHAIDVGHLGDWEGIALVAADGEGEDEKQSGLSWLAARKTRRKRQWICAPSIADEELAARRTIIISDAELDGPATSVFSQPPIGMGSAGGPPVPFSGLASFDLQFLRGHLSDRAVLLATPAQLRAVYGRNPISSESKTAEEKKIRTHSFGTTDRLRTVKRALMTEVIPAARPRAARSQPLRRTRSRPALKLDPFGLPSLKASIAQSSRRRSFDATAPLTSSLHPSLLSPTLVRSGEFLKSEEFPFDPDDEPSSADVLPGEAMSTFGHYSLQTNADSTVGTTSRGDRGLPGPSSDMLDSFSPKSTAISPFANKSSLDTVDWQGRAVPIDIVRQQSDKSSIPGSGSNPAKTRTGRSKTLLPGIGGGGGLSIGSNTIPANDPSVPSRLRKEPSKLGGWLKKKIAGGASTSGRSAGGMSVSSSSKTSSSATTPRMDDTDYGAASGSSPAFKRDPFAAGRQGSERPSSHHPSSGNPSSGAQSFFPPSHSRSDVDTPTELTSDASSLNASHWSGLSGQGSSNSKKSSKDSQRDDDARWTLQGSLTAPHATGRRASASDDDIVAHAGQAARNLSFGTIGRSLGKRNKSRINLASTAASGASSGSSLRPPAPLSPALGGITAPRISSPLAKGVALPMDSPPMTFGSVSRDLHGKVASSARPPSSDGNTPPFGPHNQQLLGLENVPAEALSMLLPLPLTSSSGAPRRYVRVSYVPFGGGVSVFEKRGIPDGSPRASLGGGPGGSNLEGNNASFSPPHWYQRLGSHVRSASSDDGSPSDVGTSSVPGSGSMSGGGGGGVGGGSTRAPPTYLFGGGPAGPALTTLGSVATPPNRQRGSVEAFRVTAMVLAGSDSDEGEEESGGSKAEQERGGFEGQVAAPLTSTSESRARSSSFPLSLAAAGNSSGGSSSSTPIDPSVSGTAAAAMRFSPSAAGPLSPSTKPTPTTITTTITTTSDTFSSPSSTPPPQGQGQGQLQTLLQERQPQPQQVGETSQQPQQQPQPQRRNHRTPRLPEPTPFPVVLITCCGQYLDFVPEGWEALGLGEGPVERCSSDDPSALALLGLGGGGGGGEQRGEEDPKVHVGSFFSYGRPSGGPSTMTTEAEGLEVETEMETEALFGIADLIVSGCAAVMDL